MGEAPIVHIVRRIGRYIDGYRLCPVCKTEFLKDEGFQPIGGGGPCCSEEHAEDETRANAW